MTILRSSLGLPLGSIPDPPKLIGMGYVPQEVVVNVAWMVIDAAPDRAVDAHAG